MTKGQRVVVVGGGAFGVTTAYRLARQGFRVTVVDREDHGVRASEMNAGNLNPLFLTPQPLVPLAVASFRLHGRLQAQLVEDGFQAYRIEPVRRVLVAFDSSELSGLEPVARDLRAFPDFPTRWLDRRELRAVAPAVTQSAVGGLSLEGNCSIDGREFLDCVLAAGVAQGVKVMRDTVIDVEASAGHATRVTTRTGHVDCDAVVLATGAWTDWLRERLDVHVPVKPIKGQMLRLRPGRPLECDLTRGSIALYRRRHGEVWVGGTNEDCGLDETVTSEARTLLHEGALGLCPMLSDAEVLQHGAALRPMTPGHVPIVSKVPEWQNLYVANGGGAKGMLLSVGVAKALEDLIVTGATDMKISGL